MTINITTTISLSDATKVLDGRYSQAKKTQVLDILSERAQRPDSKSAKRAAAFLVERSRKEIPQAAPVARTSTTTAKKVNHRTDYANAMVAADGIGKGDPGWRTAFFAHYRSAEAHAYEAEQLQVLVKA